MSYTPPKVPRRVNAFDESLPKRSVAQVRAETLRRRARAKALRKKNAAKGAI